MSLTTTLFSVIVCFVACSFYTFPYVPSDVVSVLKSLNFYFLQSVMDAISSVLKEVCSLHIVEGYAAFTLHLQEGGLICLYVTSQTSYFICVVLFV